MSFVFIKRAYHCASPFREGPYLTANVRIIFRWTDGLVHGIILLYIKIQDEVDNCAINTDRELFGGSKIVAAALLEIILNIVIPKNAENPDGV